MSYAHDGNRFQNYIYVSSSIKFSYTFRSKMFHQHAIPPTTTPKRKSKVLLCTTDEFLNRLRARGYYVDIALRDHLELVLERGLLQDESSCHTPAFWCTVGQADTDPTAVAPAKPFLNAFALCAALSHLHVHGINYVNLAVVLHSLGAQQWKNLYRYCYIEWTKHGNREPLWVHTPRAFGQFDDLPDMCTDFLNHMIRDCDTHKCVHSLFFVNRVYQYLTPCV
jgi:hypothetical protein